MPNNESENQVDNKHQAVVNKIVKNSQDVGKETLAVDEQDQIVDVDYILDTNEDIRFKANNLQKFGFGREQIKRLLILSSEFNIGDSDNILKDEIDSVLSLLINRISADANGIVLNPDGTVNDKLSKVQQAQVDAMYDVRKNSYILSEAKQENIFDMVLNNISREQKLQSYHFVMQEKYGKNYCNIEDIQNTVETAEELMESLDESELAKLIERANSGDVEAQKEISIMMSLPIYSEVTTSFSEQTDDEKEGFLNNIDQLNEFGDLNARKYIVFLAQKANIDILKKDSNGELVVDQKKLEAQFTQNGIRRHGLIIGENLEGYTALDGVEDFKITTLIEIGVEKISKKFNAISKEINESGTIDLESAQHDMSEALNFNLDSALQYVATNTSYILNPNINHQDLNPQERNLYYSATDLVLENLIKARKGEISFVDDEYTKKYKREMYVNLVEDMVANNNYSKERMDLMAQADPDITVETINILLANQDKADGNQRGNLAMLMGQSLKEYEPSKIQKMIEKFNKGDRSPEVMAAIEQHNQETAKANEGKGVFDANKTDLAEVSKDGAKIIPEKENKKQGGREFGDD